LNDKQHARFQQVQLQLAGATALLRGEIATELKLTDEQKRAIQDARQKYTAELRRIPRGSGRRSDVDKYNEERGKIRLQHEKESAGILSEQQQKIWNEKIGPPIDRTLTSSRSAPIESRARYSFHWYDVNGDGQMTEGEWRRSSSTRYAFERKSVELEFPVTVDEYIKAFIKTYGRPSDSTSAKASEVESKNDSAKTPQL